jgi:hypothetical protein
MEFSLEGLFSGFEDFGRCDAGIRLQILFSEVAGLGFRVSG